MLISSKNPGRLMLINFLTYSTFHYENIMIKSDVNVFFLFGLVIWVFRKRGVRVRGAGCGIRGTGCGVRGAGCGVRGAFCTRSVYK